MPSGDAAVLVELPDLDAMLALYAALEAGPPPGVADIVPAARTLTLLLAPAADPAAVAAAVRAAVPVRADALWEETQRAEGQRGDSIVTVPVEYDGADLAEVAELTGLTVAETVAAHTGTLWRVAFTGFVPGFGYLSGGDPRLDVPRRATPRVRVPAGAVGLAGRFSGVYPVESPGGWRLIGRTEVPLWDLDRDPPALLRPGMRVRFVRSGGPE